MQGILHEWEISYYTQPLLLLVLFIALIISIRKRKKYKILNTFPFYIIFLIMVYITGTASTLSSAIKYHPEFFWGLTEYTDYGFTIFEIVTFSVFFYQLIDNLLLKRIIIVANLVFILFSIYMFITSHAFYQFNFQITKSTVYTVEGVILFMICLFYFIEFFKKPPTLNLKNEPVFWISTGALFFFAGTLPYSVLENHIIRNYRDVYYPSYSIFYIFYILLFLMIIRAYLCKPGKTI